MIDATKIKMPAKPKFAFEMQLEVGWPYDVLYKNHNYYLTGKEGIRVKDGCPTAEYKQSDIDIRLWVGLDGKIEED